MAEIKLLGREEYTLTAPDGDYSITANIADEDGLDVIRVSFNSKEAIVPPVITVEWEIPSVDIQGVWDPCTHINRGMPCVWDGYRSAHATRNAPVGCLFSNGGENRMTFACSDAMNIVKFRFVLREEDAKWLCSTKLFDAINPIRDTYECTFRIDYRHIPYEDSVGDVVEWWAAMPEYTPMPAVEECLHPLYSTWYSFHQYAYGDEIEEVLESAAPLGFKAVIVDDGWQMEDSQRTYNYAGDWEVSPAKIKDMKAHVARVHAMGMKYYLWYSVPYMGKFTKNYNRFLGKALRKGDVLVLDPRYPEVREYLISTYENAVKDWDLDGFKLDFVDNFNQPEKEDPDSDEGRDYVSVLEAVDRLMTDIKLRLTALKPNIAIEFRQSYIGPLMRKYGNMFRAADCANDTVINKIRVIDTKLIVGTSTVHSDMITWSLEDTAESAALQFIGTMFAVPQISVRPGLLTEEHRQMLRRWIDFWEEHRSTLLWGKFKAQAPELLYTSATAEDEERFIAGAYAANAVIPSPAGTPKKLVYANGSGTADVAVRIPEGEFEGTVKDCRGVVTATVRCGCGITELPIPAGGTAELVRV